MPPVFSAQRASTQVLQPAETAGFRMTGSSWREVRATSLRDVFPDVFVLGVSELLQVTVEDHFAIAQDQKTQGNQAMLSRREQDNVVGLLIELMGGHGESVLQAVRDHQSAGPVHVALLHN